MGHIYNVRGETFVVSDKNEMVDIVRHFINDEIADYILDKMIEYDVQKERAEMEFNSDFANLERQNESYHDCIVETESALNSVINELAEGGRMNKVKLLQKLKDIQWNLNECI